MTKESFIVLKIQQFISIFIFRDEEQSTPFNLKFFSRLNSLKVTIWSGASIVPSKMMDFNTKQMKKDIQITMNGDRPQAHMATCFKT